MKNNNVFIRFKVFYNNDERKFFKNFDLNIY